MRLLDLYRICRKSSIAHSQNHFREDLPYFPIIGNFSFTAKRTLDNYRDFVHVNTSSSTIFIGNDRREFRKFISPKSLENYLFRMSEDDWEFYSPVWCFACGYVQCNSLYKFLFSISNYNKSSSGIRRISEKEFRAAKGSIVSFKNFSELSDLNRKRAIYGMSQFPMNEESFDDGLFVISRDIVDDFINLDDFRKYSQDSIQEVIDSIIGTDTKAEFSSVPLNSPLFYF